jgi:hypothetical protein
MTTGIIIYAIISTLFTLFMIGLIKGGNPDCDEEMDAAEGAFPADRFEEN